jgi:hypothetical protein
MTKRAWEIPFSPGPEVRALLPEVSGNAINGLGEAKARRATPIMWHDADILAHGDLQQWFRAQGGAAEANIERQANKEYSALPLPELAAERPAGSAAEWTARVKAAALEREADLVGIARLDPAWIFAGYEARWDWVVVLAVAMDPAALATAPSARSQTEVHRQYGRGTRAAHKLAGWMHRQGWPAQPLGGPQAGPLLMIPAAIAAGLGELGKHGSMINREHGSSFRLACVLTDMPLLADIPERYGADDFCRSCQVCSRTCPVGAIQAERQLVRGVEKWYVDFDLCIPYFVERNGCGICIGQCPWSLPGVAPSLARRMTRRRQRRAR